MKKLMVAAVLAVTICAAPPDPVTWKLDEAPAQPVKPGARFSLKLVAKIQEGWHLYSLKPLAEGPIPTRIWLPEGQPFQLAAAIQASEPQTLQDPSFNMEVELYEVEATFTLPVRIAVGAAGGSQTLVANTSYQSCNNKICLPPKTVKVEIPIAIGK
jgi:DsbC/DsbD-like thiol-disulfide interchange protein